MLIVIKSKPYAAYIAQSKITYPRIIIKYAAPKEAHPPKPLIDKILYG